MSTGIQMGMVKVNHASNLIIEDHLKKVIAKTSQKAWKASDNPFLPKTQHSAFGDFPPDYMPKVKKVEEEKPKEDLKATKTFTSKLSLDENPQCVLGKPIFL